jgi:hypothetical protein
MPAFQRLLSRTEHSALSPGALLIYVSISLLIQAAKTFRTSIFSPVIRK